MKKFILQYKLENNEIIQSRYDDFERANNHLDFLINYRVNMIKAWIIDVLDNNHIILKWSKKNRK